MSEVLVYLQWVFLSVFWSQRLTVIGEVDHGEWHCRRDCSNQHGLHYLQTRAMDVPTHTHTPTHTQKFKHIDVLSALICIFPKWRGNSQQLAGKQSLCAKSAFLCLDVTCGSIIQILLWNVTQIHYFIIAIHRVKKVETLWIISLKALSFMSGGFISL